jgi:hypothetical protein
MGRRLQIVVVCGALMAWLTAEAGARAAVAPAGIDLSGAWVFDALRSERPTSPVRTGSRKPGGVASSGGGALGGGSPSRPDMGGRSSARDVELERVREIVRQAVDAAPTLKITQRANEVVFTNGDAPAQTFVVDGQKRMIAAPFGELEARARWDKDKLIVEGKLHNGVKITRVCWLESSGPSRQLVITVKADGSKLPAPVEGRYVYVAAVEGGRGL